MLVLTKAPVKPRATAAGKGVDAIDARSIVEARAEEKK